MKIFFLLASITLLASCTSQKDVTTQVERPPTPSVTEVLSAPADAAAKFAQTEAIVKAMKNDEMNIVKTLYPDLILTKSIKRGDPEILAMMGDEDWYYSPSYDVTVVVCKDMNTPAHVFAGKTLGADETAKIRKMHEDTMKMMDASGSMMMDHSMPGDMMQDNMKPEVPVAPEAKMMKPTGYMNFDETKVKEALASGQKVALFFHATWCPTCKALDKSINAELSSIPSDALIVKVDYDTSAEMKQKYGVTSQHTTVLIDKDMNLISKKIGARNVAEVLN
ncbi:MAG: hypothetical protein HHAS10_01950 [Candidatus Altimarinota bacterium]